MKSIAFFSNYLIHHQLPLCRELFNITNGNFYFVAQKAISEKRIGLGYKILADDYDFVVKTYENERELDKAFYLAEIVDFVLFGSSNTEYLKNRLEKNKLTMKYSERLFKKDLHGIDFLKAFRRVYINHGKYRNKKLYMLCAGSFAAYDFNRFGAYKNKTYKWGYFPETKKYDSNELNRFKNNKRIVLMWAGRLINWKHPELFVKVCKKLKDEEYDFEAKIIGNGEMEIEIKRLIEINKLNDCVLMLGSMSPDEVRKNMEKSNIFIFTSDKQEGWGAVLNEAMNSGCACVVSHAVGSTGFLVKHNVNGLVFKDGDFDDLYKKTKYLMDNKIIRETIGNNAYKTIVELWNGEVAANRFYNLCQLIEKGEDTPYLDGPCSKAFPIKEKDMYDYLVNS